MDEVSKKKMSITVRGHKNSYSFDFMGDPAHLDQWREDGLEVYEIHNTVPEWVADIGLIRAWCFMQDLFNFKNPFKRS